MVKIRVTHKDGPKNAAPGALDPDAELKREMQRLAEEEKMRRRMEVRRQELKKAALEEERFSKLNRYRINNQWRKLMRLAKIESLRKELEILSQSHEREVDMKDAIIQMLDRDLDEAEEQYCTALRRHLSNIDQIIELHSKKVHTIEQEFEHELSLISDEFERERTYLVELHAREKRELTAVMNHIETEFLEAEAEARQEFESQCEEMKNKAMEDLNLLNMVMTSAIEELERHFEAAHHTYVSNTEARTAKFKEFTQSDKLMAHEIQRKTLRLQKLQDAVNNWKLKIAANVQECEERNKLLKDERESIGRHFQLLKHKMNKFREKEAKLLSSLSVKIRASIEAIDGLVEKEERILKLAELNRKLETDREKILPFEVADVPRERLHKMPAELAAEVATLTTYAKGPDGLRIDEWNYLDQFYVRYNKVLLDKMALLSERGNLRNENQDLRTILKQYLDGISVTEDVMVHRNPLLIINNRTNIVHRPAVTQFHIPLVEANQMVNASTKQQVRQPMVMSG